MLRILQREKPLMVNVVIVFNPLVGYLKPHGSAYIGDEKAEKIKKDLKAYLKNVDTNNTKVFFTREVRSLEDKYHVAKTSGFFVGSDDIEVVESFKYFCNTIINTLRANALFKTPLLSELRKLDVHKITLMGLELSSSIIFTASELRNLGYAIEVLEPLTTSSSSYLHSAAISLAGTEGVSFVRE